MTPSLVQRENDAADSTRGSASCLGSWITATLGMKARIFASFKNRSRDCAATKSNLPSAKMIEHRYGRLSAGISALANAPVRPGISMRTWRTRSRGKSLMKAQHQFDDGLRWSRRRIALVAYERKFEALAQFFRHVRGIEIGVGAVKRDELSQPGSLETDRRCP